ncbi:MAG TPA: Rossmann-like and DUF2520 domain-containing protein [Thermoleophilaceae bacterium]|nr:Rossmann-like and DUF2520 domain-containing protein [Thermoleophilaceae bacterium]
MKLGIVGKGRLGTALDAALRQAGHDVDGPAGRGEVPAGEAILLCVPDSEITAAAETVAGEAPLVGHTSGATPLGALRPAARGGAHVFGLHPLQTFAHGAAPDLRGVGCAIAGSTAEALEAARTIAKSLGMVAFELPDHKRAAYHAAASVASNFLVTLQAMAEEVARDAGLEPPEARRLLAPLVRTTVENWVELGPKAALTGPVARGDDHTVSTQRRAISAASPQLLPLFDALVERTKAIAA